MARAKLGIFSISTGRVFVCVRPIFACADFSKGALIQLSRLSRVGYFTAWIHTAALHLCLGNMSSTTVKVRAH